MLAWPGSAPLWLLAVLVLVCGMGGPASMVAFDFARTFNPVERVGGATGIVNQGGFVASLIAVVVIGLVLDWRTPGGGCGLHAGGVPVGDGDPVRAVAVRRPAAVALPPADPAHPARA